MALSHGAKSSTRTDGAPEIRLEIECGYVVGFSANGQWKSTSKYVVTVALQDPFQDVIDKLKELAGPNAKAEKIHGIDAQGNKYNMDPSKTVAENVLFKQGTTLQLRFPNLLG
eukprot:TRINITY_DN3386_c0_g1_i2.p1 TRINITY_DN3386_c0_g1~~TRINITY_DN3386_c0_g1_i2.p1  ORF type:complete len:128 (-),score=40.03 TRINITY_DN3386_c0_g1_i2:97-435(-)